MSEFVMVRRAAFSHAIAQLEIADPEFVGLPELRAVLAQESGRGEAVAIVTGSSVQWLPGAGKLPDRSPLYAKPPAPVSVAYPSVDQVMKLVMNYQDNIRTNVTGTTNWAANLGMHIIDKVKDLNP